MAPSLSKISTSGGWSLCFSGAGHLIVYHLGVAKTLVSRILSAETSQHDGPSNASPAIHSVAGSSSGALVAAALAYFPHRIGEYADRLLEDRGHAFRHLQQMLFEEFKNNEEATLGSSELYKRIRPQSLGIATTECSTGELRMFEYDTSTEDASSDHLLSAIQASCTIPRTFHPWDVLSKFSPTYLDEDGIEIEGSFFVDGGIAAPCPVWRGDLEAQDREVANIILISPISGSLLLQPPILGSIRPSDSSFKLPLIGHLAPRSESAAFRIRPLVQNLQSLVASMGAVHPQILHDWHQQGVEDANIFWSKWRANNEDDAPMMTFDDI